MSDKKFEPLDFAIQKDSETIRKEVLQNILKMIRYRGYIKWTDSDIKKFVKTPVDNCEYVVKLDDKITDITGNKEFNGNMIYIKLISQNIKSAKNNPILLQFIKNHMNNHKIVVFDDIIDKAKYDLKNTYSHIEVFSQRFLMIDLMSHDAAPASCVILSDEDTLKVKKEYMMTSQKMCKIKLNDRMSDYMNVYIGQVLKIQGRSQNCVYETRYRIVCE